MDPTCTTLVAAGMTWKKYGSGLWGADRDWRKDTRCRAGTFYVTVFTRAAHFIIIDCTRSTANSKINYTEMTSVRDSQRCVCVLRTGRGAARLQADLTGCLCRLGAFGCSIRASGGGASRVYSSRTMVHLLRRARVSKATRKHEDFNVLHSLCVCNDCGQ